MCVCVCVCLTFLNSSKVSWLLLLISSWVISRTW